MKFNSDKNQIEVVNDDTNINKIIDKITKSGIQEDAFYVFDVSDLIEKHNYWKKKLPRVIPHYVVKCNDNELVLKILASLGTGFQCSSKEDMRKILSLDIDPSKIIFDNPAKNFSHIRYAANQAVETITFDNENELYKIKALHPAAKLLLRIQHDEAIVQCPMSNITKENSVSLLRIGRNLNLDIIGICFHVRSGWEKPTVFRRFIRDAHTLFKMGQDLGFKMQVLDIGGGFPGNKGVSIVKMAEVINQALDEYFPVDCGVNIIAEPGRYFVASAFTLATFIHSKREIKDKMTNTVKKNMYYINDGIYGSFNSILYDHATVKPIPLTEISNCKVLPCSIWGPTCDGLDCIVENVNFPVLEIGDWIMFENMGAYTFTNASLFNGFPIPKTFAMVNESTVRLIKDALQTLDEINLDTNPPDEDDRGQLTNEQIPEYYT